MSEIVPRDDYALPPRAARQVSRARARIDSQEAITAYAASRRIENGYRLAQHTVHQAAQLNRQVSAVCHDNPALEMNLRLIEEDVAFAARQIIYGYMTR